MACGPELFVQKMKTPAIFIKTQQESIGKQNNAQHNVEKAKDKNDQDTYSHGGKGAEIKHIADCDE
jgi:hypothetical protein